MTHYMQNASSLLGRLELAEFLIRSGILVVLLLLFRDMTRLVEQNGKTSRWLQLVFSSLGLIVCWRWIVAVGQLAGNFSNHALRPANDIVDGLDGEQDLHARAVSFSRFSHSV